MIKIIRILLAISLILFVQQTMADPVVELDNKNYIHCIRQLESVKDEVPVILTYARHCPFAQIFLPTYREVASSASQENRAFFQFDWDYSKPEVAQKCLGISKGTMLVSPIVSVILQLQDAETGKLVRSIPIRAWGGVKPDPETGDPMPITPQELEHIITFGEELRLYKSQFLRSIHN